MTAPLERQNENGRRLADLGHELNNVAMAIEGHARLALKEMPRTGPGRQHVQRVLDIADRAALLAAELLARGPHAAAVPASVGGENRVALVAEDEGIVRELTRDMLALQGYDVVTVDDGAAALRFLDEHDGRLDLVLTDVVMPGADGSEVAEAARARHPDVDVLLMSGYASDQFTHLLDADAVLLRKPFSVEQLEAALARKAPSRAETAAEPAAEPAPTADAPDPMLTARERSVLAHLAEGATNEQVARQLGISADTVQTYVHRAMRKLDAGTRTQAVAVALRRSLIP